ncbi:unnamed protein product [Linum trigynum]|uniref:Uncharacterized protein n=1 Tax=Linum trigynum TaxID=586398 RepID=A0AAV2E702_9ROSI
MESRLGWLDEQIAQLNGQFDHMYGRSFTELLRELCGQRPIEEGLQLADQNNDRGLLPLPQVWIDVPKLNCHPRSRFTERHGEEMEVPHP